MKQRIFSLLAAMLLMSVSAMAQSGNNEPIRGDVNEDGVVNGTDIQEVINIIVNGPDEGETTTYKYYLGIISDDDLENQNAVNSLINNSTTTTTKPLTSITLPSGAPSNNGYEHIFIYPSDWGTPWVVNRGTSSPVGLGPLSDWEISNPTGYGAFYLATPKSNAGAIFDITWNK